jgi:NAD(P)-dependent dehydrogenase (short-subunit alcohol dehydrogenase family)
MSRPRGATYEVSGRTVFITGAARGIGAAIGERLHAKGANVALVGLEPERLQALAARLGERAWAFEADVTDPQALQAAVAGTVERFGGIDVAIANAGIAFVGALASAPVEQVERTFAVNLLGVWRTDRAVIEQLIARRGYLLNISSMLALTHPPLAGPYASAKAGVEALSDALRMELAASGVGVGCAHFGFMDTDLARGSQALPAFLRGPAPLVGAIDAIELGIERRSARVWAPRWVGAMITLRGVLQPLMERRTRSQASQLSEAIRLAEHSAAEGSWDPTLGVAADVMEDPS